jgi:hypothetical protein
VRAWRLTSHLVVRLSLRICISKSPSQRFVNTNQPLSAFPILIRLHPLCLLPTQISKASPRPQSTAEHAGGIDYVQRHRRWRRRFCISPARNARVLRRRQQSDNQHVRTGTRHMAVYWILCCGEIQQRWPVKRHLPCLRMFPRNDYRDRVEIESDNIWGRLVPDAALQFCAKVGATLRGLQPGVTGCLFCAGAFNAQ